MKNFKSTIFNFQSSIVFVLCTLSLCTFVGCNNGDEPEPKAQVQTYHVTIKAGKGDANQQNGPRRALGLDGNTLTATWGEGEQVTVRNLTKGTDLVGVLEPQNVGTNETFLSGDLTGTINAGDELQLRFLSGDYENQDGTLGYIAAHCDYALDTLHVTSVNWNEMTFQEDRAVFVNQQAIFKITMKDQEDHALNASQLVVKVGDATSYTINLDPAKNVVFVALPGFNNETIKLTATVGSDTYTSTSSNPQTFEDGAFYLLTIGMTKEEIVHGFSISPTQQIEFAHGNLQYKKSTNTWRIAEQQYDYVGNWYKCYLVTGSYLRLVYDEYYDGIPVNANNVDGTVYEGAIKSDNTDFDNEVPREDCWVDYFGWNTANNPLNISYNAEDYATSQDEFVDWGHNLIYDPRADITYPANTWRTLTAKEWDYIFCRRPNAAQLFGLATLTGHPIVNKIQGVIVFPDDFEVPAGFRSVAEPGLYDHIEINSEDAYYSLVDGGKWPNTVLSNPPESRLVCPAIVDTVNAVTSNPKYIYNQNVFTLDQWEQLEAAGAVFLPAAGARMEYNHKGYVRNYCIGFLAWYWSSTHQGSGYKSAYAFEASYDATNYGTPGTQAPSIHPHGATRVLYDGLPVRLVRDIQ